VQNASDFHGIRAQTVEGEEGKTPEDKLTRAWFAPYAATLRESGKLFDGAVNSQGYAASRSRAVSLFVANMG
jgi:hypothetical protein